MDNNNLPFRKKQHSTRNSSHDLIQDPVGSAFFILENSPILLSLNVPYCSGTQKRAALCKSLVIVMNGALKKALMMMMTIMI